MSGEFVDREYHKVAPVPDTPRPSIYECRQPQRDWFAYIFEHYIPLPGGGRVLDAGCGPGGYLPAARRSLGDHATLVGLDLAHGRLQLIDPATAARVCADVVALPFPDEMFDAILAMHMLYHVPHVPDAVAEFHRVLRPGGVLYAFTNSSDAQPELSELFLRHGGGSTEAFGDSRFCNENGGEHLAAAFARDDIELVESRDSELVVTDAECVVDEFERLRYALEPALRPDASWADLIAGTRRDAAVGIARDGAFRISECHGLFTCRRS